MNSESLGPFQLSKLRPLSEKLPVEFSAGTARAVAIATLLTIVSGHLSAQQLPRLARLLDIGCADCGGPTQFAEIMDVAISDSGTVLVVGNEAPMLRLFDRTGRLLWSTGASGMGPGEYRLPMRAAVGPRGLQVVDMTSRRVTRLRPDGTFSSSAPITGFPAATAARGRTGDLVLLTDNFRGTRSLHRWTSADSGTAIGALPAASEPPQRGVISIPSIAVSPTDEIAVVRDGTVYRIERIASSGTLLGTIVRDVPQVRRTAEEMAALEKRRNDRQRALAERTRSRTAPPVALRMSGDPELKPHVAIDGLRYDDAGRLWVRTMRGSDASTVFDVFRPNGDFAGELRVNARIGAFSFAGRLMAAVTETDDGYPIITVFELK